MGSRFLPSLYLCFSFILFLTSSVSTLNCKSLSSCVFTSQTKNISFASYMTKNDKYLELANFITIVVSGTEAERHRQCLSHCTKLGLEQCKTVNVAPYTANELTKCELSLEVRYAKHSSFFISKVGWTSYNLAHGKCEVNPCNYGYCEANYTSGGYVCVCPAMITGQNCETRDWKSQTTGYWSLDNGTLSNEGKDKTITFQLGTGLIVKEPGRKGRVLQCTTSNCFSVKSDVPCLGSGGLIGEKTCKDGFTFAFWLRALDNPHTSNATRKFCGDQTGKIALFLQNEDFFFRYRAISVTFQFSVDLLAGQIFKQWNHFLFRYDAFGACNVFFNGVKYEKVNMAGSELTSNDFTFGYEGTRWFLDDIIYQYGYIHSDLISKIYEDSKHQ